MNTSSDWRPTVDIIVSTFNEAAHIDKCLAHVLGQDYPRELLRVWLIDGGSTDDTVIRARTWAAQDERLTIVADARRLNLPEALKIGVELSNGELVAKIDAHGYAETDFVRRAVEALGSARPDVACVGGRPEQRGETGFGEALAFARTSRFGVGGSGYAGTTAREFVDSVQCGVYRRAPLLEVGGFDPAMNYGEDDELNWRLRRAGYHILLDTRIRFHYITRPSFSSAYRQYRNYGRARVRVVTKHPDFLRLHHLAPALFVSGLWALCALALFLPAARIALLSLLALYSAAVIAAAATAVPGRSAAVKARVAVCFPALHVGYGVGMIGNLVRLPSTGMREPRTQGQR